MNVTVFEPVDLDKYNRVHHGSDKISNVTQVTERLGNMLVCKHCGENWNKHAAWATDKVPAGMCLTESNFKLTGTYLIS